MKYWYADKWGRAHKKLLLNVDYSWFYSFKIFLYPIKRNINIYIYIYICLGLIHFFMISKIEGEGRFRLFFCSSLVEIQINILNSLVYVIIMIFLEITGVLVWGPNLYLLSATVVMNQNWWGDRVMKCVSVQMFW